MARRVLLTHHRKLGSWLQLGGHADGERDFARVALTEAEEESGLPGLRWKRGSSTSTAHWIPDTRASRRTGITTCASWCTRATTKRFVVSEESHALAWREIAALVDDARRSVVAADGVEWLARWTERVV